MADTDYRFLQAYSNDSLNDVNALLRSEIISQSILMDVFESAIILKQWGVLELLRESGLFIVYTKNIQGYNGEEIRRLHEITKGMVSENFTILLFEYLLENYNDTDDLILFIKQCNDNFISSFLRIDGLDLYEIRTMILEIPEYLLMNELELLDAFYDAALHGYRSDIFTETLRLMIEFCGAQCIREVLYLLVENGYDDAQLVSKFACEGVYLD